MRVMIAWALVSIGNQRPRDPMKRALQDTFTCHEGRHGSNAQKL